MEENLDLMIEGLAQQLKDSEKKTQPLMEEFAELIKAGEYSRSDLITIGARIAANMIVISEAPPFLWDATLETYIKRGIAIKEEFEQARQNHQQEDESA